MVCLPAIIRRFLRSAALLALLGPTGAMAAYRPDTMALRQAQAFLEPLIPVGAEPGAAENAALAKALAAYRGGQDFTPLTDFLAAHPESPWRASLLANLGGAYLNVGHYGRALHAFETAWILSRRADAPEARAVADLAVGPLAELLARMGRREALEELFRDLQDRPLRGSSAYQVEGAKGGLAYMNEHPDLAYRCGPMALGNVLAALKPGETDHPKVEACKSTHEGTSLARLAALARDLGLDMVPALRAPGSETVVPAILHWKVGHFAAIVERKGDAFRIQDPTFGEERWIRAAVIDEEDTSRLCESN